MSSQEDSIIEQEVEDYWMSQGEAVYREMISGYAGNDTCQLYRDYLDNFRINTAG